MHRALSTMSLHMNRKAYVACNFYYLFENQVLLKVTASHVHCKCGDISETVPDSVVVATYHWDSSFTMQNISTKFQWDQSERGHQLLVG